MSSPSGSAALLSVSLAQQVATQVGTRGGIPVGLECGPGLVVQLGRDLHADGDEQIASGAVLAPDALAADAERAPVRSARGDPQADRHAVMRRHLDLAAERS